MLDQSLAAYVKQNIKDGFSRTEIQNALRSAGWHELDISEALADAPPPAAAALPSEFGADLTYSPESESFFARHGRALIVIFILIVIIPVLAYAGYWGYQNYYQKTPPTTVGVPTEAGTPPAAPQIDEQAAARDQQRLKDIQALQTALTAFFTTEKAYPKMLDELVAKKNLPAAAIDPKSQEPYLYYPLGETPNDYSLAFILETDVGTLEKGLNEVSPANPLQYAAVESQNDAVKGLTVQPISSNLVVTDLTGSPFYPGEEASVTIESDQDLEEALLLAGSLKLSDKNQPFGFKFSVPKIPGDYSVRVFAFTASGQTLFQTTTLTVKASQTGKP